MGRLSERRLARVRSLVLRTLSDIISDELDDPRLGLFSLVDVRLSSDSAYADVQVATVGGPEASQQSCNVLNHASPLLWNRLRRETDLRIVPELRFTPDRGSEYQDEINRLIAQLPPAADGGLPEDEQEK
jgi:ribosome-binding factor A